MKLISKTLIGLFISGSLISCSDYLDINDSPNEPTANAVTPDLMLAGALTGPYEAQTRQRNYFGQANEFGNVMLGNWGPNVNAFTSGYVDEHRLKITTSFYMQIWDGIYPNLSTAEYIDQRETDVYDYHKAIAKITKANYFQILVDFYGDIPYTEALALGGNFTPAYDDDKMIYRSLIEDLDAAIALINNADDFDNTVGSEDVVFGGDMNQWIKYANTLKLRLLVRQITLAKTDGETASYLTEQFASLDKNFVTEDVTINPGYTNSTGKLNPFYSTWGFDSQGAPTDTYDFTVAADFAAQFMKGQQPNNPNYTGGQTGIADPRLPLYFQPVNGEVQGVVMGETSNNAPDPLSKLGEKIIDEPSQDGFLLLGATSYFLQAEAALEGYLPGNPKALFQNGIRASFRSLGIESQADDYITSSNNVNKIGWDGSANKLEAIMTQKWLATNGRTAYESWFDYVRTGYPEVPLAITAEKPARYNRLLYPQSEYITNAANVPTQTQADAFNTTIFWDVN